MSKRKYIFTVAHCKAISEAQKAKVAAGIHALQGRRTELSKKYPESYGGKEGSKAARLVKNLRSNARENEQEWKLTDIEAFELCIANCTYCGFTPGWPETRNGIDRVDNNIGYEKNNSVACCFTCNSAKLTSTLDDFKQLAINIYNNFILINNNIDGYISNLIIKIQLKCELDKKDIKIIHGNRTELGNKYPDHYNRFSREREKCSFAQYTLKQIKQKAKFRKNGTGIEWKLNDVYAFELCLSNCFYCDKPANWPDKRNGIDRVNNNIGYEINNCVPCCFECNAAKNNLTMDEFKDWIIRLYNNLILGNKKEK